MTTRQQMTRRYVIVGLAILAVLALLGALVSCDSGEKESGTKSDAGGQLPSADSPTKAIENFYSAKTKHGFATFHSGSQPDEKVEFWFDENGRYRLTWYYPAEKADSIAKYGAVRIHMISPDGSVVYYCRPEDKLSELAYTRAEKQQWTFNGPPGWTPGSGVEEDGYTVFTYTADKLWDIEGASQQFYLYDMKVYTKNNQIAKIVMRTNSKKVPVSELVESQFTINEFELDAKIPADAFELPYPKKTK
ncbi:MAG: hypothetical protein HGA39_06075 [Coriobacteriia bacterium]|nr:hypothetical protein [Coriobacteriia bacterium]